MRLEPRTWQGRTGGLVLAAVTALVAGACDITSSLEPSQTPIGLVGSGGPPPPEPPVPPASEPPATRYRVSGQVTDETGQPMVNAVVEVDHGRVPGSSNTSHCPTPFGCWLATRTNENGEYTLEVEAGPLRNAPGPGIGYVYAIADGHETNVQWVPAGGPLLVRDLELRRARPIRGGESTSVSVGPEDSLCTDLEDNWLLNYRCQAIQVDTPAGTLVVDVRAADGSGPAQLFPQTTGSTTGSVTRSSPTTLSIPASGGRYRIFVGIPEGATATQFEVVTSLQ